MSETKSAGVRLDKAGLSKPTEDSASQQEPEEASDIIQRLQQLLGKTDMSRSTSIRLDNAGFSKAKEDSLIGTHSHFPVNDYSTTGSPESSVQERYHTVVEQHRLSRRKTKMPETKSTGTSADNARSEEKVIYERSSTHKKRDRSNNEACRPKEREDSSVGTPSHFPKEVTHTSGSAEKQEGNPTGRTPYLYDVVHHGWQRKIFYIKFFDIYSNTSM